MLEQYDDLINKASLRYNVPAIMIKATIQTESSGNPRAYRKEPSGIESFGLGQFILSTARGLGYQGTGEGLYDPSVNIDLIGKLLGQLRQTYGDDVRRIYSAYNSGKPDLYLTSRQVAQHVQNFMRNMQQVLNTDPWIVNLGLVGGLVVAVIIWYWANRK